VPLECRRIGGPSGQAANLSRAGRSHSIVPTMSPGTAVSQAPPVIPTPPDAGRPIRAHPARRVTLATTTAVRLLRALFQQAEIPESRPGLIGDQEEQRGGVSRHIHGGFTLSSLCRVLGWRE
jgi:hypothetical protein